MPPVFPTVFMNFCICLNCAQQLIHFLHRAARALGDPEPPLTR